MKSNYGTIKGGTYNGDSTLQKKDKKKIKDTVQNKLVKIADSKFRKYEK